MKKHILGNSNVSVSEQVFGCWAIGGTYFTGAKDELSIAAIRQAIDSGITTLDTAYIYGNDILKIWLAEQSPDMIVLILLLFPNYGKPGWLKIRWKLPVMPV